MKTGYLVVAVVSCAAFQWLLGCTITSGGLTADGFSWTWLVTDDDGAERSCEEVSADLARLIVTDADGSVHRFDWSCGDDLGAWSATDGEREIATGEAGVVAQLVRLVEDGAAIEEQVLAAGDLTFDFSVVSSANEIGTVQFAVDVWDPQDSADASLRWTWQLGSAWIDDPIADDYPSNAECAAAGIDYVNLWVWNPEYEEWWTDTTWTEFPCGSYEHGDGTTYAGLWLEDFLNAGSYSFFLGFYAEGEQADVLVYHDDSVTDVELEADEVAALGYNEIGGTLIDPSDQEFGILKIDLTWHAAEGEPFASCYESNVAAFGFQLINDGRVAAEVPISDGIECQDQLVFETLPILGGSYQLLVSGLSTDDQLQWHDLCGGLEPDSEAATVEDAAARSCEIGYQPS